MITEVNTGIKNRTVTWRWVRLHTMSFMDAKIETEIEVFERLDAHANFKQIILEQMTSDPKFHHPSLDIINT